MIQSSTAATTAAATVNARVFTVPAPVREAFPVDTVEFIPHPSFRDAPRRAQDIARCAAQTRAHRNSQRTSGDDIGTGARHAEGALARLLSGDHAMRNHCSFVDDRIKEPNHAAGAPPTADTNTDRPRARWRRRSI
ncbi:hypothetical protein Aau02nite_61100 [Amorphoplanes auranticolor]|uniref:Uncharacterized protein n=1 Tax=Actinoplanes auranticolor TaxID=47988 RepID=A0A919SMZ2_9ACTN|nr:hypothetical protein Aau02nite_61100 [Actinoplanes auranticolor]